MNTNKFCRATKQLAALLTMIAMLFTSAALLGEDAYAASVKKPGVVSFSSSSVSGKSITVKWRTAKNAKYYQVALRTSGQSWVYVKKVKKLALITESTISQKYIRLKNVEMDIRCISTKLYISTR